jgi:hypothetical protein
VLAEAATPPRWPMYPRQFKQFLRAADPTFDERKYGSIAELMRAGQKDGLLKLERDRQGGLRVFAGQGAAARASVPHGWSILAGGQPLGPGGEDTGEGPQPPEQQPRHGALDETLDDDIGNRISGGAVDVTRETVGGRGTGRTARAAAPVDDTDDEAQPEVENAQPAAPKARRTRKTAAKKTAAKRPSTRRKKE